MQTITLDGSSKPVIVIYDPAHTSEPQIVARLDEEGYPVAS